jgi:hypothetical protein
MEKIATSKNITAATIAGLREPVLLTTWGKPNALLIPLASEQQALKVLTLIQEYGGGLGSSILQEYHKGTSDGEKGSKKC